MPSVLLDGQRVHPTSLLVKFQPGATAASATPAVTAADLQVVREFSRPARWAVLDLQPQATRPAAGQEAQALRARIYQLRQSGQFEFVEPDHIDRQNTGGIAVDLQSHRLHRVE